MTEQEFREALRRSLSGADLPDCRKCQILAQMKGETTMKKSISFRFVFVLLSLLLLTTATAAVAAGVFQGTVGWSGQPKGEEVVIMPAVTAEPTDAAQEATQSPTSAALPVNTLERMQAVQAILMEEAAKAEGDLIIVSEQNGNASDTLSSRRSTTERTVPVASWEELQALVAGTSLPLPAALPEGYDFTELRVSYDCLSAGAYTSVSTEEHTLPLDGSTIIVTRYHASQEHDIISGYFLQMANEAGDTMYIDADLTHATDNQGFGLWDDEAAQAVTVAGMDNALLVKGSARTQLFLRRTLPEAIGVIDPLLLDSPANDSFDVYTDLFIRVHATALDGDALLALFAK